VFEAVLPVLEVDTAIEIQQTCLAVSVTEQYADMGRLYGEGN